MATEVKLPQLGQTMEEGTFVSILIKEGDRVEKGDVLFEVETDKATLEVESPAEGFVKKILVGKEDTVPVNTVIAILGGEDESISESPAGLQQESVAKVESKPTEASEGETVSVVDVKEVVKPASARVVRLPQLGQTMEEGTIVNIIVNEGDKVSKGDCIFEIETDKATLEMESPAEGFVKKILVTVDQTVPMNSAVMVLADEDEEISEDFIKWVKYGKDVSSSGVSAESELSMPEEEGRKEASSGATISTGESGRVFASPRAKIIAEELGVDLTKVKPSAGTVRIVEADVRQAAARGPEVSERTGEAVAVSRTQRLVGEKMLKSKHEIPCFYLTIRADVTKLVSLRAKLNETGQVKVSFNDFLIRAVALGLGHYPIMTGQLATDHIQLADRINVGLAVAAEEGLIAPVVQDADKKSVQEIAAYRAALVERVSRNKQTLEDLEGGCITISNLGGFGIDSFIPIVIPGQCSIIGVGRITDTVMPIDRKMIVRKLMNLTLAVDHKVVNGAEAAQFLDFVKKLLESPEGL